MQQKTDKVSIQYRYQYIDIGDISKFLISIFSDVWTRLISLHCNVQFYYVGKIPRICIGRPSQCF